MGLSVRTLRDSDRKKDGGLPRGRAWLCVVAALLCAAALLAPAAAAARDLVVYGEPTLEKALKSVGSLWQARTGTRVNVFVAPTDLSYAQIDRGARCDLIFALAGTATEEAARTKSSKAPPSPVRCATAWLLSVPRAPPGRSTARMSPISPA